MSVVNFFFFLLCIGTNISTSKRLILGKVRVWFKHGNGEMSDFRGLTIFEC